jgi:hypothetical protein
MSYQSARPHLTHTRMLLIGLAVFLSCPQMNAQSADAVDKPYLAAPELPQTSSSPTMRQMIFYAMTEAETIEPSLVRKSLEDIKSKGFDSIYLEFRNTTAPIHSPRFKAAVDRIYAECSRLQLRIVQDVNLNLLGTDILTKHPETFTDPLGRQEVRVKGGRFTLEIPGGDSTARVLENAWMIGRNGDLTQAEEVGGRCRLLDQFSEGGGCAMTQARGRATTLQHWQVEGVTDGTLLVVLRDRFRYQHRDLGHPAFAEPIDWLCGFAAGRGVAGVVWDEPHFGFDFLNDAYPVSERLCAEFAVRFGYDLRPRLIDLWLDVAGRDSGQVRLDFAELLESQLAVHENRLKEKILGDPGLGQGKSDFFIGIHRTMHEELSDDFRIGSVDYFRHNRGLTAGFTDSVFEREESVVTMNLLARALGQLSTSRTSWNNSWGFRPTDEHLDYYLRLMGCLNTNWLGHAYHNSIMFGPGYPYHPTWNGMPDRLAAHRGLLVQLANATPSPDTAVLYHWRSLADFPDAYIHQSRRDLLMATLELCAAQADVTVIDTATLAAGRARDGRWVTPLGSFRRILAIWPNRLEMEAWTAIEQAAAAGVEVMLVGPPAEVTDKGADLRPRWEALTGAKLPARTAALPMAYDSTVEILGKPFTLDPSKAVPNWKSNPENTYVDHAKTWPLVGGEPVMRWDGRVIGIRRGPVTTVTTELPQIPGAITALWSVKPMAPRGFFAFSYVRGEQRLLALCSRHAKPVSAVFAWEGRTVILENTRHAVLHRAADGQVTIWGDGSPRISMEKNQP